MIKPISPEKVIEKKKFPDIVIKSFNKLIIENFKNNQSVIKSKDIVNEIISNSEIKRNEIFEKNYLDVEEIYRKEGWKVKFESPCRDENFEPFFTFSK